MDGESVPLVALTAEHYLTICLTMDNDPFNNTLYIIANKETGEHFGKDTPMGRGLAVFPDPVQIWMFSLREMPELGMSREDWYPLPMRDAVVETDDELRARIPEVRANLELMSVNENEDGTETTYVAKNQLECTCGECGEERPLSPQVGLFGNLKMGES